jgi:hypothetical protein
MNGRMIPQTRIKVRSSICGEMNEVAIEFTTALVPRAEWIIFIGAGVWPRLVICICKLKGLCSKFLPLGILRNVIFLIGMIWIKIHI